MLPGNATYGLQKLLGDDTATVLVALLVLFILDVAILRLEILDQGIDVLVLLLVILHLGLLGGGRGGSALLLVEVTRLNLRIQRRRAVVGHCSNMLRKYCGLVLLR